MAAVMKRIRRLVRICLLLVAGSLLGSLNTSRAQQFNNLPEEVRSAMALLPADSEALLATLVPFIAPKIKHLGASPSQQPFVDVLRSQMLIPGGIRADELSAAIAVLEGSRVTWAIQAKRRQARYRDEQNRMPHFEIASIVRFAEPLPQVFLEKLRAIAVKAPTTDEPGLYRLRDGVSHVLLTRSNELVVVSTLPDDEAMLLDVMRNRTATSQTALFSSESKLWMHTDTSMTFWSMRKDSASIRESNTGIQRWWLFSFDATAPEIGIFKSMAKNAAEYERHKKPMLEKGVSADEKRIGEELGAIVKISIDDATLAFQQIFECKHPFLNRCLELPFMFMALGVMIYI